MNPETQPKKDGARFFGLLWPAPKGGDGAKKDEDTIIFQVGDDFVELTDPPDDVPDAEDLTNNTENV